MSRDRNRLSGARFAETTLHHRWEEFFLHCLPWEDPRYFVKMDKALNSKETELRKLDQENKK